MSYQSWHDYGYGIKTDNLITNADKIRNLLVLAPSIQQELEQTRLGDDNLRNTPYEALTLEDFEILSEQNNYNNGNSNCIAGLITTIIYTHTNGIPVVHVTNYDDCNYIIIQATYPWNMTETMKKLAIRRRYQKAF